MPVTSSNHVGSNKLAWFSPLVPHLTMPPPPPSPISWLLTVSWPCCGPVLSETAERPGFISTSCLPSLQWKYPADTPPPFNSNKKHVRKWSGVGCRGGLGLSIWHGKKTLKGYWRSKSPRSSPEYVSAFPLQKPPIILLGGNGMNQSKTLLSLGLSVSQIPALGWSRGLPSSRNLTSLTVSGRLVKVQN